MGSGNREIYGEEKTAKADAARNLRSASRMGGKYLGVSIQGMEGPVDGTGVAESNVELQL
jgi:hypothetical protein